ncbi:MULTISPECIES: NAD+ synthase [Acidithiobacillus]|uniref:Glutamine-dependent NAD(+) synthetase n=2 Tax=Acidithiobacillus thiooxidans TaxID=930 RepID=A0A1C2I5S3_ACITH|nr:MULTISPECIES: NAD+ synthase [Acidithiobacillus]MBU2740570.1 NAD+ synthase [Acidithiobacillus albertensis]MBU2835490.1 NAD+ synthase [Acidithiobacillus thiooxidans]OCX71267.1 NAD+ synthase [Acidithiobacillus thiooxidans]OCX74132.1 NAD+ synthase [Acidithiobacillus thiooxidans]OCX77990.1 NAD+ synthase [Acidithiobacillus thiooxidans]
MRVALAQCNVWVGDIDRNVALILKAAQEAKAGGADLLVTPELALCGYPPEDLLLREDFVQACAEAVKTLAAQTPLPLLLGHPQRVNTRLYNCASLLRNGQVEAVYHKHCLPNYAVFDELRYFTPGTQPLTFDCAGVSCAVAICEDVWCGSEVAQASRDQGAELLVVLNASPYHRHKQGEREGRLAALATQTQMPICYANLVGGQDELVFDGRSFVVDAQGRLVARGPICETAVILTDFEKTTQGLQVKGDTALIAAADTETEVYAVLTLGVRDYVRKNHFPGIVLGLSGGVDSALTLAIAVDALGAEQVHALIMPSRYTAEMSVADAIAEAQSLGVSYDLISIEPVFQAYLQTLAPLFEGRPVDTTEENLQARVRAGLLMAYSNKFGHLLVTTGNKSEIAVGYATLYGDMAGGFAVIKDIPKTLVYRLARYRNQHALVIPERVLTRPPSAELAPDQQDQDSLPSYEVLDAIIAAYVENDRSAAELIASGFAADTVQRVLKLIDRAEYKRRQAAPGVRISTRAFGKDRRYPITNGYASWGGHHKLNEEQHHEKN